jgi:shikimate dehydrogenase
VGSIACYDLNPAAAEALRQRLLEHYPQVAFEISHPRAAGYDLVVNATPLGMRLEDPLPMDVTGLESSTFVGEVVMKHEVTPLLQAAKRRGCRTQVGTDMLFEQIPMYLEFFGFGSAEPEELRALARLS